MLLRKRWDGPVQGALPSLSTGAVTSVTPEQRLFYPHIGHLFSFILHFYMNLHFSVYIFPFKINI